MSQPVPNRSFHIKPEIIPKELQVHIRQNLQDFFIRNGHKTSSDQVIQEYITLLTSEKEFVEKFPDKHKKAAFGPFRGNINLQDPLLKKCLERYSSIGNLIQKANNPQCPAHALLELRNLLESDDEYSKVKETQHASMPMQQHQTANPSFANTQQKVHGTSGNERNINNPQSIHQQEHNNPGQFFSGQGASQGAADLSASQQMVILPRIEVEQMTRKLNSQHREIEELSSRLSRFASDKLTQGNPNIADLSDKNRPTKIGEKFGELYDNEWSDAFESFKEIYNTNDDEIIYQLLRIVRYAKSFCEAVGKRQLEKLTNMMENGILSIADNKPLQTNDTTSLHQTTIKYAKNYRKECALNSVEEVIKLFMTSEVEKNFDWGKRKYQDNVQIYINKCVELVWLMSVQDPPMVICWPEEGQRMDTSLYSYYGNKGKKVKLAVWPAVLLHQDGPLVSKGYAKPA